MADLQKCSKCKSEQELKYFSINKKGQLYKTCDVCRNKRSASKQTDNNTTIQDVLKLIATATQKLEGLITDESVPSDTDNKSTTAESSTPLEPPIMVFDVEHTGCMEQLVLQLSWGLYKHHYWWFKWCA